MFQFGGLTSFTGYPDFIGMGFPIRTSPDHRLFPPPRSLSQVVASFFVSESQGIHHTLLITFLLTYIVLFDILYLLPICQRTLFSISEI